MTSTKPIRIMTGGFTGRVYAVRRYAIRPNGLLVSSAKDDVTEEAIAAVFDHMSRCTDPECLCKRDTGVTPRLPPDHR